jgi:hypothetical protein
LLENLILVAFLGKVLFLWIVVTAKRPNIAIPNVGKFQGSPADQTESSTTTDVRCTGKIAG